MEPIAGVICIEPSREDEACKLAHKLKLPFQTILTEHPRGYYLLVTKQRIELVPPKSLGFTPLYVDFTDKKITYRLKKISVKNEDLAKAIGCKPGIPRPRILDATAGLGQDAMVLAGLDCTLYLCERCNILSTLLADGLQRAKNMAHPPYFLKNIVSLTPENAIDFLRNTTVKFDVIYLDPMFPTRQKSALVKREMRILSDIIGLDTDASTLLALSLQKAKKRVVVKRPRLSLALEGPICTYTINGKSIRYDIYVIQE